MDAIIDKVGNFGPFQALLFVSTSSCATMSALGMMFMVYGNYNPGWHCINSTSESQTSSSENNRTTSGYEVISGSDDVCNVWKQCADVVYNKESSTVVTEWNLVCDNAWKSSLMITIQMCGVLLGSWICGPIGDRFGRRVSLYGNVAFHGVANLLASFSTSWQMFTAFQFVIGVGVGGIVTAAFFYPMEFVGSWWRPVLGSIPIWGIGMTEFALVVYIFRDWKNFHIAVAILSVVIMLPVFWIPESIRWLALQGKQDQINAVVKRMAAWNNRECVDPVLINTTANLIVKAQSEATKPSYSDLFKTTKLRKYSIKFGLIWIFLAVVYFMISFGVKSFSGDFYLNIVLLSLAEIPGTLSVGPLANKLGRRRSAILLLVVSAMFCFGVAIVEFIPGSPLADTISITCATIAKAAIVGTWSLLVVISSELYPTFVRNLHMGYLNALARFGSIISPFMIPADGTKLFIPYAISGFLLLFASGLIFSVSESKGKPMVDTIHGVRLENKETSIPANDRSRRSEVWNTQL